LRRYKTNTVEIVESEQENVKFDLEKDKESGQLNGNAQLDSEADKENAESD
ncbi:MAG TPA: hypothetical protein GX503_00405, partial [Clostridiales bacterium]|nr:hypothetical protein [Clostridiales bacterium]